MTKLNTAILVLALMGSLFLVKGNIYAGEQEILKTFTNKTMVKIDTFSGNCIVKKGPGNQIEVRFVHTFGTSYKPTFLEEGSTLVLKEKIRLSGSGSSTWYLTVPEKTGIKYKSR